jgi:hypothetical protein
MCRERLRADGTAPAPDVRRRRGGGGHARRRPASPRRPRPGRSARRGRARRPSRILGCSPSDGSGPAETYRRNGDLEDALRPYRDVVDHHRDRDAEIAQYAANLALDCERRLGRR